MKTALLAYDLSRLVLLGLDSIELENVKEMSAAILEKDWPCSNFPRANIFLSASDHSTLVARAVVLSPARKGEESLATLSATAATISSAGSDSETSGRSRREAGRRKQKDPGSDWPAPPMPAGAGPADD